MTFLTIQRFRSFWTGEKGTNLYSADPAAPKLAKVPTDVPRIVSFDFCPTPSKMHLINSKRPSELITGYIWDLIPESWRKQRIDFFLDSI